MTEYKFITVSELSNIDVGYSPTSVFINGIQTFEYVLQDTIIYFNTMIPTGTEIVATPPDALRMLDDELITITIDSVGKRSVYSMPFGKAEFSLDAITWVKSLVHIFPETIYCRLTPHSVVLDCTCRVDIEIVIWSGGSNAYVNEDNKIVIEEVLPGGLVYEFY